MHHLDYHPNIVYYKERYQEEGRVYYVLEFADGGSLWDLVSDRCKRGVRLAEEEVRGLSRQICIGLQYIHRSGIAHLDIKPENILLTRRGQVKIADFGHSKDALSNEGLTSFGVGSPGYRAPEIISRNDSHETYTVKADCYSTGVTILFLLLEGKVPFNDDDTLSDAVWRELERQNITLIGRDFISGLVQSNPSERMDMDDALEHPWISPTVPSITAENSSGAEDPSMDNLTANPNEEAAVDTFSLTPPTLSTE
ncbi:hypothetical protein BOTBODRAFT_424452 [Botryobasidium botryosum FD-172 SS1]|uniref:non-specific serine/threonine protein kinase n=1 Tax=Botryobasidium botryosum (strain FD-172 SS1) TaxID=930990 RepID=A0A067MBN1_BOTB1|nr:hypothetical protein BOTBODRAFT_424452 [Botryobasidium botryosum FD-172 SS1]